MPGGFGYIDPNTNRPAPSSQEVGQALREGSQQGGGGRTAEVAPQQPPSPDAMFAQAAARSAPATQQDETPVEGVEGFHSGNSMTTAIGEALTRIANGTQGNPNPHKDRERAFRHLMQLGLPQGEAALMTGTGGI